MDANTKLHAYPVAIIQDRYGGTYSGGAWLAIANHNEDVSGEVGRSYSTRLHLIESVVYADDCTAAGFVCPPWVGLGKTPDAALANLYWKLE